MTGEIAQTLTDAHSGAQRRCFGCDVAVRPDRYVCVDCVSKARREALAYFDNSAGRDLLDELTIAATRQAKMTRSSDGAKSSERPLPFNEHAAEALEQDSSWLVIQACTLTGQIFGTRAAAAVIYRRLPAIVGDPVAGGIVAELHRRWVRAQRIIDRPATCGSRENASVDLYAADGAIVIECRVCSRRYDVEEQRRALLDLVEDRLATATEICRAVHLLDQPVTRSQIDNWVARGQLTRHGRNRRGHSLYRIGDVLTLVMSSARRR